MPGVGPGRGEYRASNGELFCVVNDTVYFVDNLYNYTPLGTIAPGNTTVSFADNGQHAGNNIVLVDGTRNGYIINMTTHAFSQIADPTGSFVGADVVRYLETFFIFNVPNTPFFIVSNADTVTFDPLDIAAKSSYADNIVWLEIRQRELWLIGELTTEPWFLSGAADFPFEELPSTFVPYGMAAKYSEAFCDVNIFWLAKNLQGNLMVMKSEGYKAMRVSTHALEQEWQKYSKTTDAIGGTYQINGHTFYLLHFPSAEGGRGKTWAYDLATEQWHQQAWTDSNGNLCRDRATYYANAYGKIIGLDWQNGDLYLLDPEIFNDFGDPISYIRGFPHVLSGMNRVTHNNLVVDIDCGNTIDGAASPQLNMRYSDDRGHSFSNTLQTLMGKTGEYVTSPQFPRLGMARDRVYELFWSTDAKTALNGVYVDPEEAES